MQMILKSLFRLVIWVKAKNNLRESRSLSILGFVLSIVFFMLLSGLYL